MVYAKQIVKMFGQTVCGFDILRSDSKKSFVCDVNGFSLVKVRILNYIMLYMFSNSFKLKNDFILKGNEKYMNKAGSSLRSILIKHFHGEFLPSNRRSSLLAMKNLLMFLL